MSAKIGRRALLGLVAAGAARAAASPSISVLTYHRFHPTTASAATFVTDARFAEQLDWLLETRTAVLPLRHIVGFAAGQITPLSGAATTITIDDGFRSVFTDAYPRLLERNLKATLFINPAMIGRGGAYLTWSQIGTMRDSGLIDIQAHTQTHPNFHTEQARRAPDAYLDFARREIAGSRQAIEAALPGTQANLLAWPFGIHDATLEGIAAEAGFTAAFALGSRPVVAGDPAFALPRYQIYETDGPKTFAAVVAGVRRGAGLRAPQG